jgi:hypothetical protein
MNEPAIAPTGQVSLQIDLHLSRCPASGQHAVMILVDGFPAAAPMTHVVAAIVGSLKSALGGETEETTVRPAH